MVEPDRAVHSPLVENKSSRLSHVSAPAHTQTAASRGELVFTENPLETITIITDARVHSRATELMRAVTRTAPGHHTDSRCSYENGSVGGGCSSCSQALMEGQHGRQ